MMKEIFPNVYASPLLAEVEFGGGTILDGSFGLNDLNTDDSENTFFN